MTRDGRRRGWSPERWVAVVSAIAMVVVGGVVVALRWQPSTAEAGVSTAHLTSTARHRYTDLAGLVAASDLVVVGRVVADERGRAFGSGDPDDTVIRSHVLTLEVERVLGGSAAAGVDPAPQEVAVVLVEEEHSLADGTLLVVDGMRAGRVGDRGVWFLVAGADPDFPAHAVVNAQGRYLFAAGDRLVGGDRSDALVRRVEALGRTALEAALTAPEPDRASAASDAMEAVCTLGPRVPTWLALEPPECQTPSRQIAGGARVGPRVRPPSHVGSP